MGVGEPEVGRPVKFEVDRNRNAAEEKSECERREVGYLGVIARNITNRKERGGEGAEERR